MKVYELINILHTMEPESEVAISGAKCRYLHSMVDGVIRCYASDDLQEQTQTVIVYKE